MAENGGEDLEQADHDVENAPEPREEQNAPAPGADAATAEAPAIAGAEDAGDSVVRSAYVARNAAPAVSSAGDFSQMETTDQGRLLRGAYLAHLSEGQRESAGERDPAGEDILRRAYVARIASEPRPQRGRVSRAKPKASAAGKAAAKKQAARGATRAAPAKSKPRAKSKARAARGRRGKRPRR